MKDEGGRRRRKKKDSRARGIKDNPENTVHRSADSKSSKLTDIREPVWF